MADIPKIVADFSTQLSVAIAAGGTTGTLNSNVDDDGNTLVDGLYYFTIDGSNSNKEHISCTKTGANLTNIKTVSRQGVETAGAARAHRVGATVVMTDFATYKNYIDNATINGISPATTSTLGGVNTTTDTASSVVVSTDDPRVPTEDENDALAGTGTPSASNKYVTEDTFNAPKVQHIEAMSAQAVDGTKGNYFTRTLAGDETFTQSGFQTGQCFMIEVSEVHTITWFAGITWLTYDGNKPTQASKTIYGFRCTGTNTFIGMLVATA